MFFKQSYLFYSAKNFLKNHSQYLILVVCICRVCLNILLISYMEWSYEVHSKADEYGIKYFTLNCFIVILLIFFKKGKSIAQNF